MRSFLVRFFLLLLVFLLLGGAVGFHFLLAPLAPAGEVRYEVEQGSSLTAVASDLQRLGVIRSALALRLLGRVRHLSGQIQSGLYLFKEPASPQQVLQRLTGGDVEQVAVTIPEGFTLKQIAERFANSGYADRQRFLQLARDREFIRSLGLTAESLEGYLFPETYQFSPGLPEAELLRMMVAELRGHLTPELLAQARERKLSAHQLVTLASIIEKETGLVDEMPLIASVFYNRLRQKIPLQTDPTVIYGIKNFDGNLTREHLQSPGPYNTYRHKGLPPGPIASPGLAALQAAAVPAQTDYLYFVARGDGSHQFSTSLQEHNRAVRKYQLKRH